MPEREPGRTPGQALRLYPPPVEGVPGGGVYSGLEFPEPTRGGTTRAMPHVAINMVSTVDGKAAIRGRAGGIGGEEDRIAMRNLRASADAVMVGGGTLRAEKMSLGVPDHLAARRAAAGKPPQPLAVVLSRGEDLPLRDNLVGASPENTLVLVPGNPPATADTASLSDLARVEGIAADRSGFADLSEALGLLNRGYAVDRLLVEGGPSLNRFLIDRGLAHELFLTLSPKILGGTERENPTVVGGTRLPPRARPTTELLCVHLSAGELFLRYSLA